MVLAIQCPASQTAEKGEMDMYPEYGLGRSLFSALEVIARESGHPELKDAKLIASNPIAIYSYGIYISHQFCIGFAFGVLDARPLWLRVGVLISSRVLAPILLYHFVQKADDSSWNSPGCARQGEAGGRRRASVNRVLMRSRS